MKPNNRLLIKSRLLYFVLILSAFACNLPAGTVEEIAEGLAETELFVSISGDDANDCQTPETACSSLHRAVDIANEQPIATIYIGAGTYDEAEPIRMDVPTTLIGEREVVINNIIAPNPFTEDPVMAVNLSASGAVRLENISLQNGAGIRIINGGLELVNVRIRNMLYYAVSAIEFTDDGHDLRSRIVIENSELTNIEGSAILATGVNVNVRITDTEISNTSETAIINRGGTFALDNVRIFNTRGLSGYPSAIMNGRVSDGAAPGGFFTISNAVFYDNASIDEGTVQSSGELLDISNSTISGNEGNGVEALIGSEVILTHVTIANQTGNGLYAVDDPRLHVTLINTLIVYNGRDCELRVTYEAPERNQNQNTIDSDNTCIDFQSAERAAWDFYPGVDSVLNGEGTHALQPDSPAVDAVDCILPADQRGVARPQGTLCDIGAYELEPTLGEPPFAPTSTPLAFILETPAASATLPSVPAQISASATPSSLFVRIHTDANCRFGPDTVYSVVTSFKKGTELPVEGRNSNNTWWWVLINNGQNCWISASLVEVFGSVTNLPVISAPPTPVPTSTSQAPAPTATTVAQPPVQPPSAPVQLFYEKVVCNGQTYTITLRWTDTANNEQGFRIYRNASLVTTLDANSTQYTDAPPYGGPYTYTVEAYNSAGASAQAAITEPGCIP